MVEQSTIDREFSPLIQIKDNHLKFVVTMDEFAFRFNRKMSTYRGKLFYLVNINWPLTEYPSFITLQRLQYLSISRFK